MTPAPPPRPPVRLPLLDGMRGIAAIAVMLYHAYIFGLAGPIFERGYLFVDFFFLLSGFVLGIAYEPKLRAGLPAWRFMWLRVRRLWPVMAIGAVLGLVPFAIVGVLPGALTLLPMTLLLIPTMRPNHPVFPLNNPQWSLVLELVANAVHAVLLVRLRNGLLALLVGAAGLWLAFAIAAAGSNEFGATGGNFPLGLVRVMFGYGCGLLLARQWLQSEGYRKLRWRWSYGVLLPLGTIVTLPYWPTSTAAGDIAVTILVLPLCFALTVNADLPVRLQPLFKRLGLISYPLYAVHIPILTTASLIMPPRLGALVAPIASLAVAAAIARVFERRRPARTSPERPEEGGLTSPRAIAVTD